MTFTHSGLTKVSHSKPSSKQNMRSAALVLLSMAALCGANRIHKSNLTALTFKRDALTTGRRLSPLPQLWCKQGPCSEGSVSLATCKVIEFKDDMPKVSGSVARERFECE